MLRIRIRVVEWVEFGQCCGNEAFDHTSGLAIESVFESEFNPLYRPSSTCTEMYIDSESQLRLDSDSARMLDSEFTPPSAKLRLRSQVPQVR